MVEFFIKPVPAVARPRDDSSGSQMRAEAPTFQPQSEALGTSHEVAATCEAAEGALVVPLGGLQQRIQVLGVVSGRFRTTRTAPLRQMLEVFCRRREIQMSQVRFTVDGEPIAGDVTAEELGLEDNAIIDTAFVHSDAG